MYSSVIKLAMWTPSSILIPSSSAASRAAACGIFSCSSTHHRGRERSQVSQRFCTRRHLRPQQSVEGITRQTTCLAIVNWTLWAYDATQTCIMATNFQLVSPPSKPQLDHILYMYRLTQAGVCFDDALTVWKLVDTKAMFAGTTVWDRWRGSIGYRRFRSLQATIWMYH